jgi:hypothetical protein
MRPRACSPPTRETRGLAGILEEEVRGLVALAKTDLRAFAPLSARYFDPVYRSWYRRLGLRGTCSPDRPR